MPKNTDLRVVRTRQMIKEAFFELMETVGFAKITIDSLTKKAFINRNTFYLHYVDKYDLLDKLEDEALLGLNEILGTIPLETIRKRGFIDESAIAVLRGIFEYIKENRRLFTLLMGENGNQTFLNKLGEMIKGIVMNKTGNYNMIIPRNYMIAIITGIQTNIIREWIRGGMKETPEQIVTIVATVFKDVPKNLFEVL